MILEVDLLKAFDQVSWLYLQMLLTHLGFPYEFINWIMWCITNISFSLLLNGVASTFFHSERGLRNGCPLSPLLFLLVMEGLSRLIKYMHHRGRLMGIKITHSCIITNLLFVDDVLILLNGGIRDLIALQNAISLSQIATGMVINNSKSTIIATGCTPHEIQFALHWFPFTLL